MNPGAWLSTGGEWSDGLGEGKLRSMEHFVYTEPGEYNVAKTLVGTCFAIVAFFAWFL